LPHSIHRRLSNLLSPRIRLPNIALFTII